MNEVAKPDQELCEGLVTEVNMFSVAGKLDSALPFTKFFLEDGRVVRLPTSVLVSAVEAREARNVATTEPPDRNVEVVIPLVEERIEVGRRTIVTGSVKLHKTVQEHTQDLKEVLAVRTFDVERVVMNRPVESAPPVRQEGDVTIYSLVEEQLILTKQLILKEEVRITQRDTERVDAQVVTLKKEYLSVERESFV